eukprot:515333-Prymnesium_polylepis.1
MRGATRASLVCCAGVAVCAGDCRAVARGRRGVRGRVLQCTQGGRALATSFACSSLVKGGRGCGSWH